MFCWADFNLNYWIGGWWGRNWNRLRCPCVALLIHKFTRISPKRVGKVCRFALAKEFADRFAFAVANGLAQESASRWEMPRWFAICAKKQQQTNKRRSRQTSRRTKANRVKRRLGFGWRGFGRSFFDDSCRPFLRMGRRRTKRRLRFLCRPVQTRPVGVRVWRRPRRCLPPPPLAVTFRTATTGSTQWKCHPRLSPSLSSTAQGPASFFFVFLGFTEFHFLPRNLMRSTVARGLQ